MLESFSVLIFSFVLFVPFVVHVFSEDWIRGPETENRPQSV